MIIHSGRQPALQVRTNVLVIGIFGAPKSAKDPKKAAVAKVKLDSWGAPLDKALGGLLSKELQAQGFKGKKGDLLTFHTHGKVEAQKIILLGLGDPKIANL